MEKENSDSKDLRIIHIGPSIEKVEVDFSVPRTIQIIPIKSRGKAKDYLLRITPKGGATLV